jgi:beta-phosphoglucomutase-like phosphatase (HAD superfamily)
VGGFMEIKAAIFDLDGTILDSMGVWRNMGSLYLEKAGVSPPAGIDAALFSLTLEQTAEYFIQNFNVKKSKRKIINEINAMVLNAYKNEVMDKPFVLPLLKFLRKNDVKMCIATLTDDFLVDYAIKRLAISRYFEFTVTASQIGKGKGEPDIYLEAARRLGFPVKNTVVFEDTAYCAKTAKQAGFFTIGVNDAHSSGGLEEICDLYIRDTETEINHLFEEVGKK